MREVIEIAIDDIVPNRAQPRLDFNDESLDSLALSIKENGLLQPITVRKIADKYELIAGERRLRACKLNGQESISAIVLDCDDQASGNLALIENIQREDLNVLDQAKAMVYLMKYNHLTQQELAKQLGYKQSTVANKIRLLKLPDYILDALSKNIITERHARALLSVDEDRLKEVFDVIVSRGYNVSKTEEYIKKLGIKQHSKGVSSNVRIGINTFKETYELCKKSGIDADLKISEYDDRVKLVITLKK